MKTAGRVLTSGSGNVVVSLHHFCLFSTCAALPEKKCIAYGWGKVWDGICFKRVNVVAPCSLGGPICELFRFPLFLTFVGLVAQYASLGPK